MTAEENLKIIHEMIDGIMNNNLNEKMSELGYEQSKDTEKSKEWILKS